MCKAEPRFLRDARRRRRLGGGWGAHEGALCHLDDDSSFPAKKRGGVTDEGQLVLPEQRKWQKLSDKDVPGDRPRVPQPLPLRGGWRSPAVQRSPRWPPPPRGTARLARPAGLPVKPRPRLPAQATVSWPCIVWVFSGSNPAILHQRSISPGRAAMN